MIADPKYGDEVLVRYAGEFEPAVVLGPHRCGKVMVQFPWDDCDCVRREDLFPSEAAARGVS